MAQCDGSGLCLTTKLVCHSGCTRRECPNTLICQNQEPQFILDFNNGVCNDCATHFGRSVENPTASNPILQFKDDVDCPVCFQHLMGAKNPRCNHELCLKCLKAIYWYDDSFEDLVPRPQFPHPDQEDEYYEAPELFIHDQLVNMWKKQIGSWNEERIWYVMHNKKYLKHCPICRA
jgi:hypothetical protein